MVSFIMSAKEGKAFVELAVGGFTISANVEHFARGQYAEGNDAYYTVNMNIKALFQVAPKKLKEPNEMSQQKDEQKLVSSGHLRARLRKASRHRVISGSPVETTKKVGNNDASQ